jgi:hypothetical protein
MATKSKSNPEKGLRTVSIEFGGKIRTLKYPHAIIGDFEAAANAILREQRAIEPGVMLFADRIMLGWLENAKIFSLALTYGLKEDSPDNVDAAIDSFIEAGGSKRDLIRNIITAYRYASDPSSVASLMRNWKLSDDRQSFLTKAENEAMDTMEAAILKAKSQDAKGKEIAGSTLTGSESSN